MPDIAIREQIVAKARQVVIKVGTGAICDDAGKPDRRVITNLAKQIAALIESGISVSLVASGAIGAGMGELGIDTRPKTLPKLQAAAAIGQGQLMRTFHDIFAKQSVRVAQVLLTRADFEDRTRYLNIRNTLAALSELGALPIINENDTVAVDEIRFGENDILAALLTNMLGADLLVYLTNVDGVMKDGKVLDVIAQVDADTLALDNGARSKLGSGGMSSKLTAAGMVAKAGEITLIANINTPNVLTRIIAGERLGTLFIPAKAKLNSRRRWIGQASRSSGKVVVDAGAAKALTSSGKSLLASGISAVTGKFDTGAIVSIVDSAGTEIARGLTNYSAEQIDLIKGKKSSQIAKVLGDKPYDAVIHRNNMTLA